MPKISELTAAADGDMVDTSLVPVVIAVGSGQPEKVTGLQLKNFVHTRTVAVPVVAGSMRPRSTNGCAALASVSAGAGKPDITTLNFDASADEYAQFVIPMPASWDEGTITAKFYWSHPSTTTNFTTVWGIQAVAVGNDDAFNAAFGSAVTVTDIGGTTDDLYVTDATSALTVAGSPQAGDVVCFQVFRDADAAGDNLAVDARLVAVVLSLGLNSASDA
jgi:hypothetical protein